MFIESESLELKKSLAQLKEGIISLSSMLNKSNKGRLIFGINDEGKVFGLQISNKTKQDIVHEIENHLKPLPFKVDINVDAIDNKEILIIDVAGSDTPYQAYGRYYIRINDSDILMQSSELQHFFEQKEENYLSWEQKETDYGIDDINEDSLIDLIRTANEKGRLEYVYRNPKEALNKLGLLTEKQKLNNAGYYLFGNSKPLTIKLASFPTDSRSEFGEIKEFKGNIFECINEVMSYIQNRISYKSDIIGYQRVETPEIPIKAIREIVINSFAHCNYQKIGDYNSYTIFKSKIKIYNPGPILRNIDPIKFASGYIGSKIRNILISQALFKYGYIDAFGTGFDRTFTLCSKENIEYDYQNDEFGFTFNFYRDKTFLDNKNYVNKIDKINDKTDKEIIKEIEKNKYVTIPELSRIIKKSEPTIYRHIEALVKLGILIRIGSKKTGFWNII